MKHKHLTLEERETIEDMLKENFNLTQIGKKIGKHRTTISKEILNHRFKKEYSQYNSYFSNCKSLNICQNAGTKVCNHNCKHFIEKTCDSLIRPPYVCNGCPKKRIVDYLNFIIAPKMQIMSINCLEQNLELELESHKKKYMKLTTLLLR